MTDHIDRERKNVERIFARAFTVLGGVFWIATAFAGPLVYQRQDIVHTLLSQGLYPLVFTVVVLAVGWFYERFAALILALGAIGTVAWGLIDGRWEPMVWGIMLIFFVSPSVIAATLYYLADNIEATAPEEPEDRVGAAV
jgi:hypothetical protein